MVTALSFFNFLDVPEYVHINFVLLEGILDNLIDLHFPDIFCICPEV
jgi:hypothetical protein